MHDQNQTPASPNQLPSKKPNLLHDWWEEMYPRDFLLTFKNYFFNHKKFFDEVFNEQWDDKVKPLAFLFTSIGVALIIGSISPWGLDFSEEPPQPEAWCEITKNMDSEDSNEFIEIFGLHDIYQMQDSITRFEAIDTKLKEDMGLEEPPSAKQLQKYFEENDYDLLAARAEYVVLKQQVEHDKFIKSQELTEVEQIIFLNAFVLWCMLYWLISHRFFKRAQRKSRETVFVFMYGLGMLIFFVYVPFIAISGATDENALTVSFLIVLLLFLLVLYKIFSIFRYTHNTGFFGLMIVYIKAFFVAVLFGIPLLFMWKKKKRVT